MRINDLKKLVFDTDMAPFCSSGYIPNTNLFPRTTTDLVRFALVPIEAKRFFIQSMKWTNFDTCSVDVIAPNYLK